MEIKGIPHTVKFKLFKPNTIDGRIRQEVEKSRKNQYVSSTNILFCSTMTESRRPKIIKEHNVVPYILVQQSNNFGVACPKDVNDPATDRLLR